MSDENAHSEKNLAELLGVSRALINKNIQTLKEWGVDIHILPSKDYMLPHKMQLLKYDCILNLLEEKRITILPIVDSTNQYLLDRIYNLQSGDACIAEYQRAGRGRRGRQWVSPFGVNIYLSIFWKLCKGPSTAIGVSLVISVIMAEVFQRLGGKNILVKWPNDLYLNNRKLAGILVELTRKTGEIAYLVIGAGINLSMRYTHAHSMNQGWVNLQEAGIRIDRNELASILLNKFRQSLREFENHGFTPFIERWRSLDGFINQPVKLLVGEKIILGVYRGINHQGALLLEQQGVIKPFNGGEVSLRNLR